jgi:hypothetical protein
MSRAVYILTADVDALRRRAAARVGPRPPGGSRPVPGPARQPPRYRGLVTFGRLWSLSTQSSPFAFILRRPRVVASLLQLGIGTVTRVRFFCSVCPICRAIRCFTSENAAALEPGVRTHDRS